MSSKGYLAIWAGSALLALAGCDAGNQQQDPGAPATEDESADNMAMYEPDDTAADPAADPPPTTADNPDMSDPAEDPMLGSDRSQTQGAQGSMSSGQSLESMSPDQIVGKTVVSAEGEEIGEVQEIVQDPATSQKFAVVDVGGFLGVGQKSVTIGLDELQMSQSGQDQLESDLTRETLETKTEYTPGEYEPVEQSSGQPTTQ